MVKRLIVGAAAFCVSVGCLAGDPVQVIVRTEGQRCATRVQPGDGDLKVLFPAARFTYKGPVPAPAGGVYQSCEVDIPKDKLLAKFSYCALAAVNGSACSVSYTAEGGRTVEFSAISHGGKGSPDAACSFVCVAR